MVVVGQLYGLTTFYRIFFAIFLFSSSSLFNIFLILCTCGRELVCFPFQLHVLSFTLVSSGCWAPRRLPWLALARRIERKKTSKCHGADRLMKKDGLCTVETNIIRQKTLKKFGLVLIGRTLTVMVM